jgi:glycosyltransferase involved in cell wall biosynthesis
MQIQVRAMDRNVHFIGLLRSPVSWAKVGRELIGALAARGAHVSAASVKGSLYDEAFALSAAVQEAIARERVEGWDLALDYPPNFARLKGKRKAGIVIYEGDRFPPHWAEAVRKHLDLAFVPSRFCLEATAAAGVPREMMRVAAFGVDGNVYGPTAGDSAEGKQRPLGSLTLTPTPLPEGEGTTLAGKPPVAHNRTQRRFNFLTVAAPHVRKGLKETVEAFRGAFGPQEDVGLVIKCPPIQELGKRPWEYRRVEEFLPDRRGGQIALVAQTYSEEEMAALYRAADVYVQASYGEGFGLALVEAAACGRPVITTGWGAAEEVFDASSAWLVDYDLMDASRFAYDWPTGGGIVHMARPQVEHLAQLMRRAYEAKEERASIAAAGSEATRAMTWERTAQAVITALSERE